MSDEVRVNGNLMSWSSVVFKIDGERYYGVTSITSDEKRERTYGWGSSRSHGPLGRTAGKYTPGPLKTTFFKHTAKALRASLAARAADGKSYGNVEVPIFLQVVEGDQTTTEEFERCCIVAPSSKAEENPDPLTEEIEWSFMRKYVDGLCLFDATEESV